MISVKVRSHCTICGFKVEWFVYTNENGFFVVPDAFCPNDFGQLVHVLDGKDTENKWLKDKK